MLGMVGVVVVIVVVGGVGEKKPPIYLLKPSAYWS